MRIRSAFVPILALLMPVSAVSGGFGKLPVSARAVTFGGMMVALQDDPNALFVNPAAIGSLSGVHLSTSFTKLFPGVTDDNLSYISGSAVANIGFAGNIGVGIKAFRSQSWTEGELIGTYAQSLFDLITVGGSAKFLYWSAAAPAGRLAVPEPGFSSTTLSFDAGAQIRFNNVVQDNDIVAGLSVRDITRPSIASNTPFAVEASKRVGTRSELETSAKLDIGYAAGVTYISRSLNYLAALGISKVGDVDRFTIGVEIQAAKGEFMGQPVAFTLRAGGGRSSRPIVQDDLFGGFGVEISGITLDYAFGQPTQIQGLSGTHHITLRTSF
ncbi:MAG: hypothetical protein A2X68_03170 [Ignavibacteria bacterium GWC2_56_12]|nr:MAG: hypothetical protein A2X68_03170 [Ignavibacteria bacterium GWC2_56_12]